MNRKPPKKPSVNARQQHQEMQGLVTTLRNPELLLPAEYEPTDEEMALVEQNRKEVSASFSIDAKTGQNPDMVENRYQKKAFLVWSRQHLSGLFSSGMVDSAVAKVLSMEVGTIRRWKVLFGWAKRLETLKEEEKAEDKLLLFSKNETIEHESLDVVLRYLTHIKTLEISTLDASHLTMMMKLVKFAHDNKAVMNPPGIQLGAGGVSLTIEAG